MLRRSIALIVAFAATGAVGSAHAGMGDLDDNHYLFPGQQLQTDCYSRIVYQTDGNLVIYDWRGNAAWSSGTSGTNGFVAMQDDGNLVIYDWNYNPLWNAGTYHWHGSYAVMQADGNFVIYDLAGNAHWSSHTAGFYEQSGVGVELNPCNSYGEQMSIYHQYNLPGNDYTHFVMNAPATAEACAAACAADKSTPCAAFTYVPAGVQNAKPVCWLKNVAANNWTIGDGMASGVREVNIVNNGNF